MLFYSKTGSIVLLLLSVVLLLSTIGEAQHKGVATQLHEFGSVADGWYIAAEGVRVSVAERQTSVEDVPLPVALNLRVHHRTVVS